MTEVTSSSEIPDSISIEPVQEKDWEKFKQIRLDALEREQEAFADDNARKKRDYTPETWRQKITSPDRHWLAAKDRDGNFVGIIGADLENILVGIAKITNVYVDESQRGKGLGKKLFAQMLHNLQSRPDVTELELEVTDSPQQEPAKNMYQSFGFVQVERYKEAVHIKGHVYDELVMRRPAHS